MGNNMQPILRFNLKILPSITIYTIDKFFRRKDIILTKKTHAS